MSNRWGVQSLRLGNFKTLSTGFINRKSEITATIKVGRPLSSNCLKIVKFYQKFGKWNGKASCSPKLDAYHYVVFGDGIKKAAADDATAFGVVYKWQYY